MIFTFRNLSLEGQQFLYPWNIVLYSRFFAESFSDAVLLDTKKYEQYGSFWLSDDSGKDEPLGNPLHMCARSKTDKRHGFPSGKYCVFGNSDTCPQNMGKSTSATHKLLSLLEWSAYLSTQRILVDHCT